MTENKTGNRCIYANNCPIYSGDNFPGGMPPYLYKNVFCNRGIRGWKNCDTYIYKEGEIRSSQLGTYSNKAI